MKELSDRDGLARKIAEVSRNHADGYKRAITSFSTEAERDAAEKCAVAASNTGWFLMNALGYSNEEIRQAVDAVRTEWRSGRLSERARETDNGRFG